MLLVEQGRGAGGDRGDQGGGGAREGGMTEESNENERLKDYWSSP